MSTRHRVSVAALAAFTGAALFAAGSASAAIIDFNEAADSAQLDNPGTTGTDYGYIATGGVANTGYFNYFTESPPL